MPLTSGCTPTMFDVDGLLVGYGNIAPELLIDLINAGKGTELPKPERYSNVCFRHARRVQSSHMEGTVALKLGLVHRGVLDNTTIRRQAQESWRKG